MYAVVELKYDEGKMFAAPVDWIIDFKPKFPKTKAFLCYWTSNLQDNVEEIDCGYALKFTGKPSLFRVFIKQLTGTIEEAENYLKGPGRPTKVPKRFRDPSNTDAEIKKIEAKKRRSNKKELKIHKAGAQTINMEYLVKDLQLNQPSTSSMLKKPQTEHSTTPAQEQSIHIEEEEINELSSSDLASSYEDVGAANSFELMDCDSYDEWIKKLMIDKCGFEFDSSTDEHIEETVPIISGSLEETTKTDTAVPSTSCNMAVVSQPFDNTLSNDIEAAVIPIRSGNIVEESQPVDNTLTTNQINESNNELNIIVINFDEIKKQNNDLTVEVNGLKAKNNDLKAENETLTIENNNLKTDLQNANKRNLLLQNYLVEANERVPETMFIEKDGGRLYSHDVFLTKKQCSVLDKAKTDREFLNNLIVCVFNKDELRTHSVSGAPCNKTKTPGKTKLNPEKLKLVYDIVDARSLVNKTEKLSLTKKNAIVGKKIANICSYKPTENNNLT